MIFLCKEKDDDTTADEWMEIEAMTPGEAAESFAGYQILSTGAIVQVRHHGEFQIQEKTEYLARQIKGY